MNTIKAFLVSMVLALACTFAVHAAGPAVNINSANVEQLASLNGIGESKAAAIIAWRQANGPFRSVEQLAEVKGVGLKTVEKNRERLTIGGTSAPAKAVAASEMVKPTTTP
jgi:competence protein ComEA